MDIVNVIREQVVELEQRLHNAVQEYTYATNGLRVLNALTAQLRKEAESNDHQDDTAPRMAAEK